MPSIAEAFITLRPDGSKFASELEKVVGSALGNAGKVAIGVAGAAVTAAGGLELLARGQQEATRQVAALSAQTGIEEDALRQLAVSLANVDTPLKEVLATLQEGSRQGLQNAAQLAEFQQSWDRVADATNIAGDVLAKQGNVLQTVGIDAAHAADAMDAFGFVQTQTTGGVQGLLDLLARRGATIHQFGLELNDVAALLAVMQRELGLTGRALTTEFERALTDSNGTLAGVLAQLGVSQDVYDRYRNAVAGSASAIDGLAAANTRAYTPIQKLKQQLDELLFTNADQLAHLASFATIISGSAAAATGAAAATRGLSTALTAMGFAVTVSGVGLAVLVAGLVVGAVAWDRYTDSVNRANREQEALSQAADIARTKTAAEVQEALTASEQRVAALEAETGATNTAWTESRIFRGVIQGTTSDERDNAAALEDARIAVEANKNALQILTGTTEQSAAAARAASDAEAAHAASLYDVATAANAARFAMGAEALAAKFAQENMEFGTLTSEQVAQRNEEQQIQIRDALQRQVQIQQAVNQSLEGVDPEGRVREQLSAVDSGAAAIKARADAAAAALSAAKKEGKADLSELEKSAKEFENQMTAVWNRIRDSFRSEQAAAIAGNGSETLEQVQTRQQAMLANTEDLAARLQQALGVDVPTSLGLAFDEVAKSSREFGEKVARIAQEAADRIRAQGEAIGNALQSLADQFRDKRIDAFLKGEQLPNEAGMRDRIVKIAQQLVTSLGVDWVTALKAAQQHVFDGLEKNGAGLGNLLRFIDARQKFLELQRLTDNRALPPASQAAAPLVNVESITIGGGATRQDLQDVTNAIVEPVQRASLAMA